MVSVQCKPQAAAKSTVENHITNWVSRIPEEDRGLVQRTLEDLSSRYFRAFARLIDAMPADYPCPDGVRRYVAAAADGCIGDLWSLIERFGPWLAGLYDRLAIIRLSPVATYALMDMQQASSDVSLISMLYGIDNTLIMGSMLSYINA